MTNLPKTIRALKARIAELEKLLSDSQTQGDRVLAILKLEQQANGIESLITFGETIEQASMNGFYKRESQKLRNQAKALKEQGE